MLAIFGTGEIKTVVFVFFPLFLYVHMYRLWADIHRCYVYHGEEQKSACTMNLAQVPRGIRGATGLPGLMALGNGKSPTIVKYHHMISPNIV